MMDSDEAAMLMANDPKILSGIITKMAEDAVRMQDEIERLQKGLIESCQGYHRIQQEMQAEINRYRIDAERYHWLIGHASNKVLDQKNQMRIEVAVSYYGGGYQLVGQAISDWIDRRLPKENTE